MKRRSFIAMSAMAASASFFMTGCNLYDDIYNWTGVAIASLNSMVTILNANGITPAAGIVNAVLGALNAIRSAITAYRSTTPPPIGAIAKIETGLHDAVDAFSVFLKNLNIPGFGLFSMIAALVQIIFSTVAGFLQKLPTTPAPVGGPSVQKSMSVLMRMAQQTGMAVVPKHRTIRQFKKDWNAQLDTSPSMDVVVPQSAYHKLSFFEHL